MQTKFGVARLSEFRSVRHDDKTGKPKEIEINGLQVIPSDRFFRSVSREFKLPENVYRLFSFHEVFERLSQRYENSVRFCIERGTGGPDKLLGVSSLRRAVPNPAELIALLETYEVAEMNYGDGVITSFFTPPSGHQPVRIGPDEFIRRLALACPVDGFGAFETYLSVLRLVCSNGLVGYAPAFRSEVRVGNDILHSLERELASFDGNEGFDVIAQRLQAAQTSPASVHEVQRLYRMLRSQHHNFQINDVLPRFDRMTGDLCVRYGEANLEAFPPKRQKILPAGCQVYDLLNFSTELATHYAKPAGARALHAHVGTLISEEYDLEGTQQAAVEFRDVFFTPRLN